MARSIRTATAILESFRLDGTMLVWTFKLADALLERRVWMAHGANTTYMRYDLLRGPQSVELKIAPLVTYRRSMATAGVPPRVMGIGPVPATRKALERAGLSLDDIGVIELNEAFAAQALAVLHAWRLDADDSRINPPRRGHCAGASVRLLRRAYFDDVSARVAAPGRLQFGLATMCIGVGQGIAMIVERVN